MTKKFIIETSTTVGDFVQTTREIRGERYARQMIASLLESGGKRFTESLDITDTFMQDRAKLVRDGITITVEIEDKAKNDAMNKLLAASSHPITEKF